MDARQLPHAACRRRRRGAAPGCPASTATRSRGSCRLALELGLEPLVEAHAARELDAALTTDARLIGINNRDLRTLAWTPDRRGGCAEQSRTTASSSRNRASVSRPSCAAGGRTASTPRSSGEDLMRAGSDPPSSRRAWPLRRRGRRPRPGDGPGGGRPRRRSSRSAASPSRRPGAAIAAGADAIGLNFVPGHHAGARRSPRLRDARARWRALRRRRATVRRSWASSPIDPPPRSRPSPADWAWTRSSSTATSRPTTSTRIPLPVFKALHVPRGRCAGDAGASRRLVAEAERFRAKPNLQAILLDTSDPSALGGTGKRAAVDAARAPSPGASRSSSPAVWMPATSRRPSSTSRPSASTWPAAWSRGLARPVGRPRTPSASRCSSSARGAARRRPAHRAVRARPGRPGPPGGRCAGALGHGARLRRPIRARDADGRAARAGAGVRADPRRARVLGGAAPSPGPLRRSTHARCTAPIGWRRSSERRAGRDAAAGCACTSSARTSPTRARTRSTTRWARRC